MPQGAETNNPSNELNPDHIKHLESEGFIAEHISWMQLMGICSLSESEARAMGFVVNGKSSSGIYFPFTEGFGQFRFDEPLLDEKGKPRKYTNQAGVGSKAYIPDGCKVITEGIKDGLAGCWHGGIPTGALAGVSHSRKALPEGAGYIVLFDADGWNNPSVFTQLFRSGQHLDGKIQLVPEVSGEPKAGLCEWFKYLSQQGKDKQAEYRSLIDAALEPSDFLLELPKHWKGLKAQKQKECVKAIVRLAVELDPLDQDDLIRAIAGNTRFSKSAIQKLFKAEATKAPQTGLIPIKVGRDGEKRLPQNSVIANILAEHYRHQFAWNIEEQHFYRYASERNGLWSREPIELVYQAIANELNASGGEFSSNQIKAVADLLKADLAVRSWDDVDGLIPMANGVLDLTSMTLKPHAPGYRLRWQLPYEYDPNADCPGIREWLHQSQEEDPQRVQLLRAYLKAIVCGRADLQRFLEIVGPGGSGKGTYTRLAIALVGNQNVFQTELKHLENNRFETSGIYGKRLVVVSDSERYGGSVSVLKALTGQDLIRHERKFQQATEGFAPKAMVLIAANEPIQSSDYTSGLERRRLTLPFPNQVPAHQRRDLITLDRGKVSGEFAAELPGLLNWVLTMPDAQMVALVRDTARNVPSLAQWRVNSTIEANPMLGWIDECLVLIPDAKTYVGVADKLSESSGSPEAGYTQRSFYRNWDTWLYASYCQHCLQTGSKPVTMRRFSPLLDDLFRTQLKLPIIRDRDSKGSYFQGVEIRREQNNYLSRPITGGLSNDGLVMGCDGSVMDESIGSDGFDGNDGSFQLIRQENNALSQSFLAQEPEVSINKNFDEPVTSIRTVTTNGLTHLSIGPDPSQMTDKLSPSIQVGSKVARTDATGWIGKVIALKDDYAEVLFYPDTKRSEAKDVLLSNLKLLS